MGYRYRNCKNATGEEGLPGEPIQKAFGMHSRFNCQKRGSLLSQSCFGRCLA